MMKQFFNTKQVRELIKDLKKELKKGKTLEEIKEEFYFDSLDAFYDNDNNIFSYLTYENTEFVGNFLKKKFKLEDEIKKVTIDKKNLNIGILIDNENIIAYTPCVVQYKDKFVDKFDYEIIKENR